MTIDILFNEFPVLTTKRLTLRQIIPNDVDAIYTLYSDDQVTQFIDIESLTTHEQTQDETNFYIYHYNHKNAVRWAITLNDNPSLIGTIGFHNFDKEANWTEIGYDLIAPHWHRGIMSEAVHAVLTYGFETLHLHRIEANVTVGNEASAKLLEKLGFLHEGTLRDRMVMGDRHHSLMYYGLLLDDYINHEGS